MEEFTPKIFSSYIFSVGQQCPFIARTNFFCCCKFVSFCCCKFWDFASSFQTKVGVHAKKSVKSIFFSVVQQCPFISSDQVVQTKNLLMLYSFQLSNNAPLSFQSKKFTPNNLLNLFSFQLFNNAPLLPEQTCVSCFSHPSTFCNFFCLLTFSS